VGIVEVATMLALTREQRVLLAETVRDIANVAAGAMVFGHFVGDRMFSWWTAVGGIVVWVFFVSWAMALRRGR
jgi:hypothetical protein